MEVTDKLGDQESYDFPKGGLGKKGYRRNYLQVDARKTTQGKRSIKFTQWSGLKTQHNVKK